MDLPAVRKRVSDLLDAGDLGGAFACVEPHRAELTRSRELAFLWMDLLSIARGRPTALEEARAVLERWPDDPTLVLTANAALIAVFAKWLDVPKSTVALDAGGKSRLKSLRVSGDGTALAARLAARLAQDGS